jgi:hypothetical protein
LRGILLVAGLVSFLLGENLVASPSDILHDVAEASGGLGLSIRSRKWSTARVDWTIRFVLITRGSALGLFRGVAGYHVSSIP